MRKVYSIKPFAIRDGEWRSGKMRLENYRLYFGTLLMHEGTINPGESICELGARLLAEWLQDAITLEGELGEAYDTKGESLYLYAEYDEETVDMFTRDGVNGYRLTDQRPIAERVESLKQSALAKLSPAEKTALGLD